LIHPGDLTGHQQPAFPYILLCLKAQPPHRHTATPVVIFAAATSASFSRAFDCWLNRSELVLQIIAQIANSPLTEIEEIDVEPMD
jgi:hypothetical protein